MSRKKIDKIPDTNTKKSALSKNVPVVLEEYLDMMSNKMAPATSQTIEKYAIKFYLWTKDNKQALRMHEFCSLVGISRRTLLRWRNKYTIFDEYYEEGMLNLADRREIGAINRIYDPGMIRSSMAFYDPEWLEAEERRAKLNDGNPGKGNVTVVMQSFDEEKK